MAKFEYDPDRALNLHTRIKDKLDEQAKKGVLRQVGISPILWPDRKPDRHPSHLVAPLRPIYSAVKFDQFKRSITPGITPDFWTQSTLSSRFRRGLVNGSATYYNVPGFMWVNGKLEPQLSRSIDPDWEALERLVQATHKSEEELVRATVIRFFPSVNLGIFIYRYEKGLLAGTNPYHDSFLDLANGLTSEQLKALQRNPPGFIRLLELFLEQLKLHPNLIDGPNFNLI